MFAVLDRENNVIGLFDSSDEAGETLNSFGAGYRVEETKDGDYIDEDNTLRNIR